MGESSTGGVSGNRTRRGGGAANGAWSTMVGVPAGRALRRSRALRGVWRLLWAGAMAVAVAVLAAHSAAAMCCYCYDCTGAFCTENPLDSIGCAQLCMSAGCNSVQYFIDDGCSNGCGFFDTVKKERCRAAKLKAAGKYGYCRIQEARKAVITGRPADYSRCDDRLLSGFAAAENSTGGICPSTDDAATVQAFISTLSDKVDRSLGGGGAPTCP